MSLVSMESPQAMRALRLVGYGFVRLPQAIGRRRPQVATGPLQPIGSSSMSHEAAAGATGGISQALAVGLGAKMPVEIGRVLEQGLATRIGLPQRRRRVSQALDKHGSMHLAGHGQRGAHPSRRRQVVGGE